jgi:hypothetical protein
MAQTIAVDTPTSAKSWSRNQRSPRVEANAHPYYTRQLERSAASGHDRAPSRSNTRPAENVSAAQHADLPFPESLINSLDAPAAK